MDKIIFYLLPGSIWTKELLFTSHLCFQNSFYILNSWFGKWCKWIFFKNRIYYGHCSFCHKTTSSFSSKSH